MKSRFVTLALVTFYFIVFSFGCKKDFNSSSGDNGIDTSRLLKQYRIYNAPGTTPDSIITKIMYDTIKHTIILNQYYEGLMEGPVSTRYSYNAAGYLTDVGYVYSNNSIVPVISVSYDQNMEVSSIIAYYSNSSLPNDTIAYTTSLTAGGKQVTFFDTAQGGYLGGSRFGIGRIQYNSQGQIISRSLTGGRQYSPYFDTTQFKAVHHEFFSYDASGNLSVYQFGGDYLYDAGGSGNNLPSSIYQEIYLQHDIKGNELNVFEQTLLKGVIHKLSGNALVDPLGDVVGVHQTYSLQNIQYPVLQINMESVFNTGTNSWEYQTFSNKPVYDSIGRLTKTTLLNVGEGNADIYFDY